MNKKNLSANLSSSNPQNIGPRQTMILEYLSTNPGATCPEMNDIFGTSALANSLDGLIEKDLISCYFFDGGETGRPGKPPYHYELTAHGKMIARRLTKAQDATNVVLMAVNIPEVE